MNMPTIPSVPNVANLISHTIRTEGEYPRRRFVAVLEYPDCTREFDGTNWKVVKDKRPHAATA